MNRLRGLLLFLVLQPFALCAETEDDIALWAGGMFLWERERGVDYSLEYQARFDENVSSLNNHFFETMAYHKWSDAVLINGGYRYTMRPDRDEHRLYLGGFWDMTRRSRLESGDPNRLKAVLQVGYQHDFDVKFDDEILDSNSIRWVLVTSRPVSEKITPFLLAGVLTTWNDAYSFGIDKVRLGGGAAWRIKAQARLRCQYIYERFLFRTPKKNTNIFWLRLEMTLG